MRVIRFSHVVQETPQNSRSVWLCKCACGRSAKVSGHNLVRGNSKSCGCRRFGAGRKTHGMSDTREHHSWKGMIQRCTNRRTPAWKDYGGRGIRICARWRRSFAAFFADMGRCPSRRHSLDRWPNNDGDYSSKNCRWATKSEQARNRRRPT